MRLLRTCQLASHQKNGSLFTEEKRILTYHCINKDGQRKDLTSNYQLESPYLEVDEVY